MPRKMIFRIRAIMDNNMGPTFMIATHDKSRVPMLVDNNRMLIEQGGNMMVSWQLIDEYTHTLNMPEEKYRTEIEFCDIVDGEI